MGHALGFLVLVDKAELAEKYILMATQLTTFLALKLLDQIETEQKMLTSLLDDILFKQNLDEQELRERLELFGLKPHNLFRVLVVSRKDGATKTDTHQVLRHYGIVLRQYLGDALVVLKPDEAVLITANQVPDSPTMRSKWLKKLSELVADQEDGLAVGFGPAVAGAKELKISYNIAKRTLRAGLSLGQSGVLHYSDYFAHTLLQKAADTPEHDLLLSRVVRPLKRYDEEYNSSLLATLAAAIFAEDLEAAATALHVHSNTIRYRLNKIGTLTGYDFFTAQGRYLLTTALLLHRYHEVHL
jgi:purine catabolism regulator